MQSSHQVIVSKCLDHYGDFFGEIYAVLPQRCRRTKSASRGLHISGNRILGKYSEKQIRFDSKNILEIIDY